MQIWKIGKKIDGLLVRVAEGSMFYDGNYVGAGQLVSLARERGLELYQGRRRCPPLSSDLSDLDFFLQNEKKPAY